MPLAAPSTVTLELWDSFNANLVTTLPSAENFGWSDVLNAEGNGQLDIAALAQEVDEALVTGGKPVYGQVVRCKTDDVTRFAWLVEENEQETAKEGEQGANVMHIKGRGTLAYLEQAVMYPERGVNRLSPDTRVFNFASRYFDDSAWPNADEKKVWGFDITGSSWNGLPKDFPDPAARWIWGASGAADSDAPEGDCYFRKSFTLDTETAVIIVATADDGMTLYLDDAPILYKDTNHGTSWPSMARTDIILDAGEHILAAKATNLGAEIIGLNIAGMVVTVMANIFGQGTNGSDFGDVILHTDDTWKALEYPDAAPGMCPGQVLGILFLEAQSRGALPALTWTFTIEADSNGDPWEVCPEFGFDVGINYLNAVLQMQEVAFDIWMDPESMELVVLNHRGADQSVTLEAGVNVTDLEHHGDGQTTNLMLQRFTTGWSETEESASIATRGRHEAFLSVGSAPSDAVAALAASAVFAERAAPPEGVVVTHEGRPGSGEQPYVDYATGDRIFVSKRSMDTTARERVRAITVSIDDNGWPIYVPELNSMKQEREMRIQRWLKRMSMGTVGGVSENAAPYGQTPKPNNLSPPTIVSGGDGTLTILGSVMWQRLSDVDTADGDEAEATWHLADPDATEGDPGVTLDADTKTIHLTGGKTVQLAFEVHAVSRDSGTALQDFAAYFSVDPSTGTPIARTLNSVDEFVKGTDKDLSAPDGETSVVWTSPVFKVPDAGLDLVLYGAAEGADWTLGYGWFYVTQFASADAAAGLGVLGSAYFRFTEDVHVSAGDTGTPAFDDPVAGDFDGDVGVTVNAGDRTLLDFTVPGTYQIGLKVPFAAEVGGTDPRFYSWQLNTSGNATPGCFFLYNASASGPPNPSTPWEPYTTFEWSSPIFTVSDAYPFSIQVGGYAEDADFYIVAGQSGIYVVRLA